MSIAKLTAGVKGNSGNSTGLDVANAVNATIDEIQRLNSLNRPLRVTAIGDSITQQNISGFGRAAAGYFNWFMAITNQRFIDLGITGNSGSGTQVIAGDVPNVIAKNPDICIVLTGTNDIGAGRDIDDIRQYYDSIITQLQNANIFPVFMTVFPNSDLTPLSLNSVIDGYNDYLISRHVAGDIGMVDINKYMRKNALEIHPELTPDGVHPNVDGALQMGYALAEYFDATFPYSTVVESETDNYFTNPYFDGTAGSRGNNATGDVITGGLLSGTTNCSVVGSIGTVDALTLRKCQLATFNSANDTDGRVLLQIPSLTIPAGDYEVLGTIEFDGNAELRLFNIRLASFAGDTFDYRSMQSALNEDCTAAFPKPFSLRGRLPTFTTTGSTNCHIYLEAYVRSGTGTIKFSDIALRKVA